MRLTNRSLRVTGLSSYKVCSAKQAITVPHLRMGRTKISHFPKAFNGVFQRGDTLRQESSLLLPLCLFIFQTVQPADTLLAVCSIPIPAYILSKSQAPFRSNSCLRQPPYPLEYPRSAADQRVCFTFNH